MTTEREWVMLEGAAWGLVLVMAVVMGFVMMGSCKEKVEKPVTVEQPVVVAPRGEIVWKSKECLMCDEPRIYVIRVDRSEYVVVGTGEGWAITPKEESKWTIPK